MKISIDIDDGRISEAVNRGIEEIDRETLGKIVNESLKSAFSNQDTIRDILLKKNTSYGGYVSYDGVQDWVKTIIADSVSSEDLESFKKKIFEVIEMDGKNIIIETMVKTLLSNMFSYDNQRNFEHEIMKAVSERN